MNKLTTLPYPFIEWYWLNYADGNECPSYERYDRQSEYGCSQYEYWNGHGDIVMSELKPWLIKHKSLTDIHTLLERWITVENSVNKQYNEYYTQMIEEIERLQKAN